ncbi:hypothetical protein [Falsigemmobacter faecalis]|uniref:hypothetical protein n=1 Tax=Falsigemmobacter faecalis TaxID=2488730 RepID=UPI001315AC49|nr:hypothetical protein [Falsigemmobacter faecalis]
MANPRATFTQSDLTKVLKAYRDAGYPAPSLVIEPGKITAKPASEAAQQTPNEWDEVLK